MSKKKKVKHSNIPLLLILLLITGACSIAAVYQYLKNRPAENVTAAPQNVRRESEKTSVSNGKQEVLMRRMPLPKRTMVQKQLRLIQK